MDLHNPAPVTVDQVVQALSVLGQEVVADPEYRPDGPTRDDLPELLGGLLGRVEFEVATAVDPNEDPPHAMSELQDGWRTESENPDVHRAVLVNRLHRTAFDIGAALGADDATSDQEVVGEVDGDEEDEAVGPPGVAGAAVCALAAADLLAAQAAVDDGRARTAHHALDSVEGFLAQALLTAHLLRLQLRAEEEEG
ncbi:hypothetical protein [Streptacidiphilus fuscans]|uniref:Uncharacterized protein n=1 Tax=Streptacidiphilus fuscans TaxID=2789292 RepID=A0A931BEC4_9ACTN|nr:hypothetical protein [Streptacidiphilus fuscans]MBF9073707.1 hypothetical protein [Streptacidiphilus fuscans]